MAELEMTAIPRIIAPRPAAEEDDNNAAGAGGTFGIGL